MFRQRAPRSAAQRFAIAVVAALTLALGYYLGHRVGSPGFQIPSSPQALVAARDPVDLADLALTNHYGQPFGAEQLAGRWSLLAFAHPADVEQVRAALQRLVFVHNRLVDRPSLQAKFRGLVVALDPVADPRTLRALVDIDSPDFLGLSGEPDVVARLADDPPGGAPTEGLALVDPKGRLVGRFTAETPPATIAGDLKALARATAAD
jgi:cytochrome oxidase Cu insertion factor (SCO1/SenC/PrrC family)